MKGVERQKMNPPSPDKWAIRWVKTVTASSRIAFYGICRYSRDILSQLVLTITVCTLGVSSLENPCQLVANNYVKLK